MGMTPVWCHCVSTVSTVGMNWWDRDLTELICCLDASLLCHTLVLMLYYAAQCTTPHKMVSCLEFVLHSCQPCIILVFFHRFLQFGFLTQYHPKHFSSRKRSVHKMKMSLLKKITIVPCVWLAHEIQIQKVGSPFRHCIVGHPFTPPHI